ncbi:MAG: polysaccharide biosynthesis/export family protein [Paludibacteraceae bacterium]|nr:polysaccharide biosynthesis/export family protein [Paludibacteraceae bacterium]
MTLFSALLLSSCVVSKKINYLQTRDDLPQYSDTVEFSDYQLQKGDYIYIRLTAIDQDVMEMFNGFTYSSYGNNSQYFSSDNSSSRLYLYLVDEQGCIEYPYVGKLNVLGLTLRQVKMLLEDKLKDMVIGFSIDARLANRTFSILGEAGSGKYIIPKEKFTIFEALAMSGDLQLYSRRSKIQVIRQTNNGTVVKTFDIRSRSIIDSEFYYIQPNDVIYVPFSDAKVMGADHVTSVISLTMSTISFGVLIYSIIDSIIKASKK